MLPYWLLYSVFAAGAIGYRYEPRPKSLVSPLFYIGVLFALLFVGLRWETGGDWPEYTIMLTYTSQRLGTALAQGDPGYMFLNWMANEFGLGLVFVNFVCGTIFMWCLARFARNEPNPWLTILVAVPYLIIVVSMGYTRQAVAIALMMAAMVEFSESRWVRFALLAIFAAMFHRTSIILLPIIAVSVVRHRALIWGAMGAMTVVLFDFLLSQFIARFTEGYLEAEMTSEGAGVRVAMNVVPAIIFLIFQRRLGRNDQDRQLWRNFSLVALISVVGLFAIGSSTVVDRLSLYLIPLQLVVLGRVPYAFPRNGQPNVQLVLVVALYSAAIQFVWLTYATHAFAWLPYQSLPFAS